MGMGGVGRGTGTGGDRRRRGLQRDRSGEGGGSSRACRGKAYMQGEKQVISGRNNIQGRIDFNITFPLANSGGEKYDNLMLTG